MELAQSRFLIFVTNAGQCLHAPSTPVRPTLYSKPAHRVATYERSNGETLESSFDLLVGADGVNSRVRSALQDIAPGFTVREQEVICCATRIEDKIRHEIILRGCRVG